MFEKMYYLEGCFMMLIYDKWLNYRYIYLKYATLLF